MANFIADTKNKIQDLFVYLVSCGKSSKELGNDQGPAKDVAENEQDNGGLIIIDEAGNAPIAPITGEQGNNAQEQQQDFAIFPPGDPRNNIIYDQPENNNDEPAAGNEQYYVPPVNPEGKAYVPRAPAKPVPPKGETG
ncbi:PREDICTED: uncharacterized protein LOC109231766 [Nicotiana attenuata]|uniref:Uncharacterized protein n=1 Tax=Nicotiana attenuata TaxID=49451 RepID=A0A1J6I3R4_NICAT|nr:PREDICTED: uncharacterized protein LOC109231766 [Nicotiana attenuata]OIS99163.1 hypothetical protein A4A49_10786 [Nicotiana attenuata]